MPAEVDFIVLDARIDLKNWDKAVAQMEADARGIEKDFEQHAPKVTAEVDVKVDDQKIKRVDSDLQALKSGVTVDIGATNTEAQAKIAEISSKLDDLKKLTKLQLILEIPNILQNIGDVVQNAPIISSLVEMDTVLGQIQGRTGEMIPGAETLIKDLYTNAWGDSVTAIGEVVTAAKQLGVTNEGLSSAVEQAFILEALGIGDATESLRTMDTMVKNQLVPTYQDAANVIIAGFQEGANKGGDLLDTFNEYGSTFRELGLSGEDVMAFINSGLAAGVDNSDRIADALRETNIRLSEMDTDENIKAAFENLDSLSDIDLSGMWAGFQAGDIDGGEFYNSFFQALEDASVKDPTKAKELAAVLVGTIAEDFGIQAVSQLSNVWDPAWGEIENRAAAASTAINNNLGTAITELVRTIEVDLVDSLNEALNLDVLIDKAKQAIQRLAAALREGKALPEALEIALEMPGLADQISRLESTLGNFIIDFLAGIASIGEALGQDMGGLRETVARAGAGQLEFDLQNIAPEDIRQAIETAMTRGVSGADINTVIGNAIGAELEKGDMSGAQAIADGLKASMDVSLVRPLITASGSVEEAINAVRTQLDLAQIAEMSPMAAPLVKQQVEMLENQLRTLEMMAGQDELLNPELYDVQINNFVAGLNQQLQEAVSAGDFNLAKTIGEQLGMQNIDQFISEQQAQSTIATLFPKPTEADTAAYLAENFDNLKTALTDGDYSLGADAAQQLFSLDNPIVRDTVDAFATDLMFAFDDAMAAGNVGEAQNILDILGLGEVANSTAFASLQQQLADFSAVAVNDVDNVTSAVEGLGGQITSSSETGVQGISKIYGAITSETGVLSILRLDSLAKRFDAVASALKGALEQFAKAEEQVGSGPIEGMAVGGVGHAGMTMVGEGGREMVFADERFAVLNNQTTERLYTALSGMAGVTNNTSTSRMVNYNPTIIVQNDAQAALLGSHALDQLRGEAF